jgi:two-component system sensor histidine kinase PilS (NtrC family)
MKKRRSPPHWDFLLPAAALVVVAASMGLAFTAAGALRDRHALTVQGRLSLLAHRIERELRESDPELGEEILAAELAQNRGFLEGLAIRGGVGDLSVGVTTMGDAAAGGTDEPREARRFELYLGPAWHGWITVDATGGPEMRHIGGRRGLEMFLAPAALQPPRVSRLLVPAAALAGAVLLGLSVLGGRLLMRQRHEEWRRGERRRLEGMARAGAGLAHQLRTPLATIKGSCQLLQEQCRDRAGQEGTRRRLGIVLEQTERMDRLLGDLLDYARPPAPEPADVELAPELAELAELDPRVRTENADALSLRVDPEHLRHVLINLVSNALEHSPEASPVEVTAHRRGEAVEISVADRGPGPGDDPEHLFEPYVTHRADGTGLGLPIARALTLANGGTVALTPRPGGGTVAVVLLPRVHGGRR